MTDIITMVEKAPHPQFLQEQEEYKQQVNRIPLFMELERKVPPAHGDRCLIECYVQSFGGVWDSRCYDVQRIKEQTCGYRSSTAGGQLHWTDKPRGPNGEKISTWRHWIVTEDRGYITSAYNWTGLLGFLMSMRADIRTVVYDDGKVLTWTD